MQINKQAKASDNPEELNLKNDSQKQRCPYVQKHLVQSRVFAAHIDKCRASLPKKILEQFATCKYNSLHIYSIYYIDTHQLTCPNRQNMIELQRLLLDKPKILQEQISQMTSQSSKRSKQNEEKADQSSYFNNTSQKLKVDQEKPRLEQQKQVTQITNKKLNERLYQNSKGQQVSNRSAKISKSKFKLQLHQRLQQIEEIKKWNERYDKQQRHHSEHEGENNKQKELQLYECSACCQILCNLQTKLWKNKKLIKLLKAYSKLQKEQSQIQQSMKSISKIQKILNKLESSQRQIESILIQSNISNESKGSEEITDLSLCREQPIELLRRQTIDVGPQEKEKVGKISKQIMKFEQTKSLRIGLLESVCNKKKKAEEMVVKQKSDQLRSNWVIIKDQ